MSSAVCTVHLLRSPHAHFGALDDFVAVVYQFIVFQNSLRPYSLFLDVVMSRLLTARPGKTLAH